LDIAIFCLFKFDRHAYCVNGYCIIGMKLPANIV